jgi:hypothetical protein
MNSEYFFVSKLGIEVTFFGVMANKFKLSMAVASLRMLFYRENHLDPEKGRGVKR